jgi:hypothetical protein
LDFSRLVPGSQYPLIVLENLLGQFGVDTYALFAVETQARQ